MKSFYYPQFTVEKPTELLLPTMKGFYLIIERLLKLLVSAFLKCQKCFPVWSLNQDYYPTQHCASKYSVFLNFRGRDTRHNFVRPLHEALQFKRISAFKDDISVNKGERIRGELFHAIEECEIAIVILSKNYADSVWCLEELVKIMKRKKVTVFPVFYDVCPSEVRNLSGSFAQAFAEHERNHEPNKVMAWKHALKDAAEISGFDLRNYKGDESKCIQDIIKEVRKKVEATRREENVAKYEERRTGAKCRKRKPKLRVVLTELGRTMMVARTNCVLKVCKGMTTPHLVRVKTETPIIVSRVCMYYCVRTKQDWMGFSLTIHTTVLRVFNHFVLCQQTTTKVKVVRLYLAGMLTQILNLRVCYSVLWPQTTKATCPRIKPGTGSNLRVFVYFVPCQQTTTKTGLLLQIELPQIAMASPPYYPHQRLQPIQPYLRERNASYSLDLG